MKKVKKRKLIILKKKKGKNLKQIITFLAILIVTFSFIILHKSLAVTLDGGIKILATVAPSYSVTTQSDTLYLKTNMILFVNGKRMRYK